MCIRDRGLPGQAECARPNAIRACSMGAAAACTRMGIPVCKAGVNTIGVGMPVLPSATTTWL
eukprot:14814258-Alexandrium_andersonii.AAC.1